MSEKAKKACELCKEQPATVLCAECCRCYCDGCSEFIHGKTSMKGHKTEAIPEGVIVDGMCPLHKDVPLKMFCVDEVKMCCSTCKTKKLHKKHNVVDLSDISQDNETFSASEVRKHFADVLKCDDELDRKIEETIESIRKEGNEAIEKVKQTFKEAHEKLTDEEAKIMEELERACNESGEVLQKNLGTLREIRDYSRVLSEADSKGKEFSRLMELNLVCSMEQQKRTMEELHRAMMTDLKIGWDSKGRKLSFTRTLFNGAPIPTNISFPSISSQGMDISWDCDLSQMSEEDRGKVKYAVEMKKGSEEERGWKEVYSGTENKCSASGLERDTEYNVRAKCVIGELHGRWSDAVNVRTKNLTINSEILVSEENGNVFEGKLFEWCRTREFELLYRGTRDGFGAGDFHRTCDNKGKTLVLIKNTSGHVFGGFAATSWPGSGQYKKAPGSFLFTLTNMHGIHPTKFHLKNENDDHAICRYESRGPVFGNTSNGDGILISSDCNSKTESWSTFSVYKDTTGKGNSIFSSSINSKHFQVKDIEVFRVNV